jgi:hypothetical protein
MTDDIKIESMVTITGAEYVRLMAENAKLRAALERIADTDPDQGTQWFHDVARAALEGDT